jgi:sec-independent protein translocase protein TatC
MSNEAEMSFLDHLEELRWHVVRSVAAIFIGMIVVFIFSGWIFDNIIFAVGKPDFIFFKWLCALGTLMNSADELCVTEIPMKIQSRLLTGQFSMQLTASFVLGLIVAFPYVFWEIWRFVKPGLHRNERSNTRGAVFFVSFLFLTGVCFGYFILSPFVVWFLSNYSVSSMVTNEFDITSFVSTVAALVLGCGVLFQLPMVIFFLTKIGIMTPAYMRANRKYAVIIILVVGAIITPPDPLSQSIVAIPLYILYEVSIFVSAMELRRKAKRELEEARLDQPS